MWSISNCDPTLIRQESSPTGGFTEREAPDIVAEISSFEKSPVVATNSRKALLQGLTMGQHVKREKLLKQILSGLNGKQNGRLSSPLRKQITTKHL